MSYFASRPAPGGTALTAQPYLQSLDGLRTLAVLAVMLYHLSIYPLGLGGLKAGWVGVQLFFVLSGFLISRILLAERGQPLGFYLRRFYWRRSLRIFPLYFAYLGLVAVAHALTGSPAKFAEQLPWLLSYTYNFSPLAGDWHYSPFLTHLWSLSVEEQFYLLWPLVVYFVPGPWLRYVVAGLWLGCPLLRWWLADVLAAQLPADTAPMALYWFTASHFDAFATGAAIVLFGWEKARRPGLWALLALALVLAPGLWNAYAQQLPWDTLGYPIAQTAHYQHVWSYTLLNFFFAAVLVWAMRRPGLLAMRLPVAMGRVSYGMYVYHWALLSVAVRLYDKLGLQQWGHAGHALFLLAYVLAVYAVAWASFHAFERYFIQLKDKYFATAPAVPAQREPVHH